MEKTFSLCILTVLLLIYFAAILTRVTSVGGAQEQLQENSVINYRETAADDPIAHLQKQIDQGEVTLEYVAGGGGYLPSVLKYLQIPVSSQGLVFSKTSFQSQRISPANPRAVFFNDDIYVGWVRGGEVLELAAADPQLGGVFYRLDQTETAQPKFVRDNECLQCHVSNGTKNVPGFQVRSVYPDESGFPLLQFGSHVTNDSSPFEQRWGGWYITGTHGSARHAGNTIFTEKSQPEKLEQLTGGNLTSLAKRVDLSGYASSHSDIVALLVLEHQTQMHNLLTRLNYETRLALHNQDVMSRSLDQPLDQPSESTQRRIASAADELIEHLLFIAEIKFPSPVKGTSRFADEFSARGPKDKAGRSLRELDLKQRLFRYPCSYLIYSEAFEALPKPALDYVYRKLWLILSGQSQERQFQALDALDRKVILEILRETKQNLPAYYRNEGSSSIRN